jgi:hypothetical protein
MCFPSPTIAGTAEPLRVSPPEAVVYPDKIKLEELDLVEPFGADLAKGVCFKKERQNSRRYERFLHVTHIQCMSALSGRSLVASRED